MNLNSLIRKVKSLMTGKAVESRTGNERRTAAVKQSRTDTYFKRSTSINSTLPYTRAKPRSAERTLGSAYIRLADSIKVLFRKCKRTIWAPLIRYASIIALVLLIGYGIANLNIFFIQNFEVEGFAGKEIQFINSEAVKDSLDTYYGQRLFLVNTEEIANSLKKEFAFIDTLYVTKHVPDTIKVRIVERTPYLVLGRLDNNTLFPEVVSAIYENALLIDKDRYIVGTCSIEGQLCEKLPVCLFLDSPDSYQPGDTVYFAELDEIIALDGLFSRIDIKPEGYAVPETKIIVVAFEDGTRAIFSLDRSLEEQVSSFEYTRENLALEGKTYLEIDFRYDRPVMRVDKYTSWVTE